MMLADFPPSSRVTLAMVLAVEARIFRPVAVEPVNEILEIPGWSMRGLPCFGAVARHDIDDSGRDPGLEGQFGEPDGGQRRELGGLEHHRVPGGQRRPDLPGVEQQREFQGTMAPTTPSGSRRV